MIDDFLVDVLKKGYTISYSYNDFCNAIDVTLSMPTNTYFKRSSIVMLNNMYGRDGFNKELEYVVHKMMSEYEKEIENGFG